MAVEGYRHANWPVVVADTGQLELGAVSGVGVADLIVIPGGVTRIHLGVL